MHKFVQLLIAFILVAVVCGRHLTCVSVVQVEFFKISQPESMENRSSCGVLYEDILSSNNLTFFGRHNNGSLTHIDMVNFVGGHMTKLPRLFDKSTNQEIMQVLLINTKTTVLNAQFFAPQSGGSVIHMFIMHEGPLKKVAMSVESLAFRDFASLELLMLMKKKITFIAPDAFVGLHKMVLLSLVDIKLETIQPEWFQDLGGLRALDLSENQLKTIPDNAFNQLTKLKELVLNQIQISTITKKVFAQNAQLKLINLSKNQIKSIETGTFQHLVNLTELLLLGNQCIDMVFKNQTLEIIDERLTRCYPTNCIIPTISKGRVFSVDDNSRQTPGNFFELKKAVKVICKRNYSTDRYVNLCEDSGWKNEDWPKCQSE